jgi:hypothetical protein
MLAFHYDPKANSQFYACDVLSQVLASEQLDQAQTIRNT